MQRFHHKYHQFNEPIKVKNLFINFAIANPLGNENNKNTDCCRRIGFIYVVCRFVQ